MNGLIVDYVGLDNELAKAVAVKDTGTRKALPADIAPLFGILTGYVEKALKRFAGVDRSGSGFDGWALSASRLDTGRPGGRPGR